MFPKKRRKRKRKPKPSARRQNVKTEPPYCSPGKIRGRRYRPVRKPAVQPIDILYGIGSNCDQRIGSLDCLQAFESHCQQLTPSAFLKKETSPHKDSAFHADFHGVCLDTEAQKTVIGESQAGAYCRFVGVKIKPRPSRSFFRFGSGLGKSLGTIQLRIPTPDISFMLLTVDVVRADVPFLVGLDVLDTFKLVDTVENNLKCALADWFIPAVRKLGHVYIEWKSCDRILFTKSELTQLHRGMYNPAAEKVKELIKRLK